MSQHHHDGKQLLTVDQALAALGVRKERKRRLPWAEAEAERVLNDLRGTL